MPGDDWSSSFSCGRMWLESDEILGFCVKVSVLSSEPLESGGKALSSLATEVMWRVRGSITW